MKIPYLATVLFALATAQANAGAPSTRVDAVDSPAAGLPSTTLVQPPQLPRRTVDTTLAPLSGRVFDVFQGDDLQAVIDRAARGDTIRVDPAGEWPAIVLPAKPGDGWIHIQSMALSELPAPGERVSPQDARHMPTIFNDPAGTPRPALNTELGASHYRVMGLRFKSRPYDGNGHNKMLMMGRGNSTILHARSPDDLPHHLILDRCVVAGWPGNTTRGLYLDGRDVAVIGCQIIDVTAARESHGILITDSPGPILIENNAIGASGVNIFIGDNNPLRWPEVNAADVTIRDNLLYKKPHWKDDCGLKNHFEMKRGERVLFARNECDYSPVDAQVGYSIKLKTGGHDQYVQDVTIRHNRIHRVGGYLAISNTDVDDTLRRVLSYENEVRGISRELGAGTAIMLMRDGHAAMMHDVAFMRDSLRGQPLKSLISFSGRPPVVNRFECRGLVADHGQYGVKGEGAVEGTATLRKFCETFVFAKNTLHGATSPNVYRLYPAGNQHWPSP